MPGTIDTNMTQEGHNKSFWRVAPEELVPLAIAQVRYLGLDPFFEWITWFGAS